MAPESGKKRAADGFNAPLAIPVNVSLGASGLA
jgi:hypothetical protein